MTEQERASALIQELCAEFPERRACSYQERAAQERLARAAAASGAATHVEAFEFNLSLYGLMALHFGIAVGAAVVTPWLPGLAAALYLVVGVSYWADSGRRRYLLRRLLPWRPSQNVLAVLPAVGERRLRVVLPAHVDAAFTGWVFSPEMLRRAGGRRTGERQPYHARSMEVVTDAVFVLAALALGRALFGWGGGWYRALELVLTVPPLVAFVLNLQVFLRDEVVPGASDNLSGVATNLLLIDRFVARPADGVELVFAFTGAEEAGTGGAYAMAERHEADWSKDDTVVVGVDTTCNGGLRWLVDGELERIKLAPAIEHALREVIESDPRFADVRRFEIPAGATDAMPFLARGYRGVTIGCVDTDYGAPRHYHHPSDTPERIDPAEIVLAADFVEALVRALAAGRPRPVA